MTKNPFQVALYENTFKKYMDGDEYTQGDECLVDMDEPRGKKISHLPGRPAHPVSTCKAFVATTSKNQILIAVFDIYGKFYECYVMDMAGIRNLSVKKIFGGMVISFYGQTQFGRLKMEMNIPKRQFGTDLKLQKQHLEKLIQNLNGAMQLQQEPQPVHDSIQSEQNIKEETFEESFDVNNPLIDIFKQICIYRDRIEELEIDWYELFKPASREKLDKWEEEHQASLPEGYKNFLLLSNGFDMKTTAEIYPIEQVTVLSIPDYEGYYAIGAYIGDGSMLLTDGKGKFYKGDYAFGIEESIFENFLETWVLDNLKDVDGEIPEEDSQIV